MPREEIINKILDEYRDKRTRAARERDKRIAKVYEEYPRIKEIDREIYIQGFQNMQNILKNPEKSDEFNLKFKNTLKALNDEKSEIITSNYIDEDYLKYNYECEKCSDTGYTSDGRKCTCFVQKIINEEYLRSNLGEILSKQNFNTFSFDYYSKENDDSGISPYENINNIYKRCRYFCKHFKGEGKSLLFYGNTGLGKTFLSSCIAKELIDNGMTVLYTRATKLFSNYEDYRFGRMRDKSMIDNLYNCDLLIIDDLGTEANNKNNLSFLLDVLNERLAENRKIIISTNLTLGEISKMYSTRFSSRLFENFILNKFIGEDIRIQKLKGKR